MFIDWTLYVKKTESLYIKEDVEEMESVTLGIRGSGEGGRRRRKERGGTKRVDPTWLKRLRLKLQQRTSSDTYTPSNTHPSSKSNAT